MYLQPFRHQKQTHVKHTLWPCNPDKSSLTIKKRVHKTRLNCFCRPITTRPWFEAFTTTWKAIPVWGFTTALRHKDHLTAMLPQIHLETFPPKVSIQNQGQCTDSHRTTVQWLWEGDQCPLHPPLFWCERGAPLPASVASSWPPTGCRQST